MWRDDGIDHGPALLAMFPHATGGLMDTGYQLGMSLIGTIWEPDFMEIVNLALIDFMEA